MADETFVERTILNSAGVRTRSGSGAGEGDGAALVCQGRRGWSRDVARAEHTPSCQ